MYLMQSAPGPRTIINGKEVDYFSGCGYYDLQGHPDITQAACEAIQKYGIASGTSPLVYGNNPALQAVHKNACKFFESESALYYVSGVLGHTILVQGLKEHFDVIFMDEESHYSVLQAAALVESEKPVFRFKYRDVEDFTQKIKKNIKPGQRPLLICDGIFPISGELSPLPDYYQVLAAYDGAIICVDDAHATGVIGEKGQGTFEYFGLQGEGLYSAGTLSKALGGHGGIITGTTDFIKMLNEKSTIQHAGSPTPVPAAAAADKAFEILMEKPGMRKELWGNVAYAKMKLRTLGFELDDSPVPIICLHSKSKIDFAGMQKKLFEKEIAISYLPYGRYTSVPVGGALRISIFSTHTHQQIDRLVEELNHLI